MVHTPEAIGAVADKARSLLSPCRLCPRQCLARRAVGERGFCGVGGRGRLATAVSHKGEEPPLCGPGGAAALFFSGCNLRCTFCQNYQISRFAEAGEEVGAEDLAATMLRLQREGCSHLDLVSPTPHLPFVLEALALARARGLSLPAVVNTNGYLTADATTLWCEACELFLLDVKFASQDVAARLCGAADYPEVARRAALQASEALGPLVGEDEGSARSGLIARHLVLPGFADNTRDVLTFLATIPRVTVSLMAQYHPSGDSALAPPLESCLGAEEYLAAIDWAGRVGVDHLLFQEPGCGQVFLPDFERKTPFLSG